MTAAPHNPSATAQRVHVRSAEANDELRRDLAIADRLSTLLDSQFNIAGVKFGLDGIIGLVPGVGDGITGLLSLYPIYLAGRHNLGGTTIARMLGNVGIDFIVGLVPVLGDFFDVAFKANRRNFKLFREAVDRKFGPGTMDASRPEPL